MIPLELDMLRDLVPGQWERAVWASEVTGVQVDSRRIEEGDLFVAVGDGAAYTKHAFARGAAATLVPDDALRGARRDRGRGARPQRRALRRDHGLDGKDVDEGHPRRDLRPQARTVAAEQSFNNEIGVPLTLCRLEPDTEICIVELAMRGFGQIAELCEFTRPQIGAITNIAPVHLEKVGTLDGVVRAKSELIAALPPAGTAIVPAGFPVGRDDIVVVRVGESVMLESFEPPLLRTSIGSAEVNFSAQHLAQNALVAFAAARALGLDIPERLDVAVHRVAEPGAAAARRRAARQRRLEREPALDARSARAPARSRRRPAPRRRARRDGGARQLQRRGARRGRAVDRRDRRRRARSRSASARACTGAVTRRTPTRR